MKKLLLSGLVAGMLLSQGAFAASDAATEEMSISINAVKGWVKDTDQAWSGKDMVWYKIDEKASLWWSKDGKKWEAVKEGMWQDKDNKWVKIADKKLVWSADGGKTWGEVPEWKWQGADGKWYKFDDKWTLWINE